MMLSIETCPTHSNFNLTFLCTQRNCNKLLCSECIFPHCKEHQTSKTYPEIKSIEVIRQELSDSIGSVLKTLYQELEDLNGNPHERLTRCFDAAEEEVKTTVKKFFLTKRQEAFHRIQARANPATPDNESSQVKANLQLEVQKYEELNSQIHQSYNDVKVLQNIAGRNLDNEMKKIKDDINNHIRRLQLYKSSNLQAMIEKTLQSAISIGESHSSFGLSDKIHEDIEVTQDEFTVIKKKMTTNTPSICLGKGVDAGVHKMMVRIDFLESGPFGGFKGWVGMGFIDNDMINLSASNYSAASCICSDQSTYKLVISNMAPITVGVCYEFRLDFNTGELDITGDNGLVGKASGFKGKTAYPYFEFTAKHQITILSYESTL